MSARVMLGVMIAGTAFVMLAGARPPPPPTPPAPQPERETPWLTREAANQIVGPTGALGPLFADVFLGGPAPSAATRERIAAFAKDNGVSIDLDVDDGDLVAIRFVVTYGGCCGYEGADALGMRLGRPRPYSCCVCGTPTWTNAWSMASDTGVHARVRINVNQVSVLWERRLTDHELLDRAERLLGADRHTVARGAGSHWRELSQNHYLLEVPYAVGNPGETMDLISPMSSSLIIDTEGNEIVRVELLVHRLDPEPADWIPTLLRARWGRPRIDRQDNVWSWRKPDRILTADVHPEYYDYSRVRITKR